MRRGRCQDGVGSQRVRKTRLGDDEQTDGAWPLWPTCEWVSREGSRDQGVKVRAGQIGGEGASKEVGTMQLTSNQELVPASGEDSNDRLRGYGRPHAAESKSGVKRG